MLLHITYLVGQTQRIQDKTTRVQLQEIRPTDVMPRESKSNIVDLVIFTRFYFSRISQGGQIRKFKNLAKTFLIIAL